MRSVVQMYQCDRCKQDLPFHRFQIRGRHKTRSTTCKVCHGERIAKTDVRARREKVRELAMQGMTRLDLAGHFDVGISTIDNDLKVLGLVDTEAGGKRGVVSRDDCAWILDLSAAGTEPAEIARIVHRTEPTVMRVLNGTYVQTAPASRRRKSRPDTPPLPYDLAAELARGAAQFDDPAARWIAMPISGRKVWNDPVETLGADWFAAA